MKRSGYRGKGSGRLANHSANPTAFSVVDAETVRLTVTDKSVTPNAVRFIAVTSDGQVVGKSQ